MKKEHKIPIPWCIDSRKCTQEQWDIIHAYRQSIDNNKGDSHISAYQKQFYFQGITVDGEVDCEKSVDSFIGNAKLYTPQEAIDLIQGKQEIKFEVGKFYSFYWNWSSGYNMICKVAKQTDTVVELSWYKNEFTFEENTIIKLSEIENIKELSLEEIQEYLPDNHVDKVIKEKQYNYEVVHCTTQEEWDFASTKIGRTSTVLYRDLKDSYGYNDCLRLDIPNSSRSLESNKKDNVLILSFQEWCDRFHKEEKWIPKVGDWVVTNMFNTKVSTKTYVVKILSDETSKHSFKWCFNTTLRDIDDASGEYNKIYPFDYHKNPILRKAEPHEIPKESKELTSNDLIEGEYYYVSINSRFWIIKYNQNGFINLQSFSSYKFIKDIENYTYRLATQQERNHLDQCIAAGKYVDYQEPDINEEDTTQCTCCDGNGRVMKAVLEPNGHRELWETCPDCSGYGFIENEESELDIWLRETKAKNLSLRQLENYIANQNTTLFRIFHQLEGKYSIHKAKILYDLWNPKPIQRGKGLLEQIESSKEYVVLKEKDFIKQDLQILEEKQFKLN